jgi:chemosensory pili system protein ChpA (sensor histidine kinase/response regulator)
MTPSADKKVRILVADDTELFRNLMEELLTRKGYEVLLAKDGLEALQMIKHELPDLDVVLLDLLMPKMTGFDVLREVRKGKLGQSLPVLCITNVFKDPQQIETLQKMGANGFMSKDLTPAQIVERIEFTLAEAAGSKAPASAPEETP